MHAEHEDPSRALVWGISFWQGSPLESRKRAGEKEQNLARAFAGGPIKWCGYGLFICCHRFASQRCHRRISFPAYDVLPNAAWHQSGRGSGESKEQKNIACSQRPRDSQSTALSVAPPPEAIVIPVCPNAHPLLSPWAPQHPDLLFAHCSLFIFFFIRCQQHKFTKYIPSGL